MTTAHKQRRTQQWASNRLSEHSFIYKFLFSPDPNKVRPKAPPLTTVLCILKVVIWLSAVNPYAPYPSIFGTGALACTLTLRHTGDSDHILVFDQVTQKLQNDNQLPVNGIYLSLYLGHFTILFVVFDTSTAIISLGLTAIQSGKGMGIGLIILLLLHILQSLDGMLMLFTYTWGYNNSVRKLYQN